MTVYIIANTDRKFWAGYSWSKDVRKAAIYPDKAAADRHSGRTDNAFVMAVAVTEPAPATPPAVIETAAAILVGLGHGKKEAKMLATRAGDTGVYNDVETLIRAVYRNGE